MIEKKYVLKYNRPQTEVFIQAEAHSVILEHLQEEELPSKD